MFSGDFYFDLFCYTAIILCDEMSLLRSEKMKWCHHRILYKNDIKNSHQIKIKILLKILFYNQNPLIKLLIYLFF